MRKKVRGDQKIVAEYDEGMNDIPMDSEISFNKKKSYSMLQPSTRPKPHSVNISNIAKTKNSATSFPKLQVGRNSSSSSHESSLMEDDYKFIERFNRDMMDQFMEHQRRTQVCYHFDDYYQLLLNYYVAFESSIYFSTINSFLSTGKFYQMGTRAMETRA